MAAAGSATVGAGVAAEAAVDDAALFATRFEEVRVRARARGRAGLGLG